MKRHCFGNHRLVCVLAFIFLCCTPTLRGVMRSSGGCARELIRVYEVLLHGLLRNNVDQKRSEAVSARVQEPSRGQVLVGLACLRGQQSRAQSPGVLQCISNQAS